MQLVLPGKEPKLCKINKMARDENNFQARF